MARKSKVETILIWVQLINDAEPRPLERKANVFRSGVAVHKDITSDGNDLKGYWKLSHVNTGYSMWSCGRKKDAMEFASYVDKYAEENIPGGHMRWGELGDFHLEDEQFNYLSDAMRYARRKVKEVNDGRSE